METPTTSSPGDNHLPVSGSCSTLEKWFRLRKPQKHFFLVARPLRGGGTLKAVPLRKNVFFNPEKKISPPKNVATKLKGVGIRP